MRSLAMTDVLASSISSLEKQIISCRKCPRLVRYLAEIREKFPAYWCHPVPGFGDPNARILLIGLAPGRFGSNRTGRMFTGDASGDFLYPVLYEVGLATKLTATSIDDGLKLKNAFITAVIRCAPPQNKPKPEEISNCRSYLTQELQLLLSGQLDSRRSHTCKLNISGHIFQPSFQCSGFPVSIVDVI